jgi:predicted RNA-binding protein YlqC (UPF0109 family)
MSAEEMSKSAKRRAAKKARDATAEEEAAPPPAPEPVPAAKSKAAAKSAAAPPAAAPKAAEPKGKAKAKAKAEAKAEPAPAPKAAAKAEAKAKAQPEAKAAAQPKAESKKAAQPSPEQSKAKAKGKAKAQPAEPPKPKEPEIASYVEFDDGSGGGWDVASSQTKKQQKQQERKLQKEAEEKQKKQEEEEAAKKAEAEKAASAKKQSAKAKATPKAKVVAAEAKPSAPGAVAPVTGETPKPTASADPEKPEEPAEILETAVVPIPSGMMGRVIGPRGVNIETIKMKIEGIKTFDTAGGSQVTIVGAPASVPLAEAAVKELIEKGYMSLSYEDFAEGKVLIHPSSIPEIIGSRGAVINKIKEVAKVEIKMPEVPKGKDGLGGKGVPADASKKYPIEIVGDKENVEKAKQIITDIMTYGHHADTHEDVIHEELDIPPESYRYIIGRAGSELRHTQNHYEVKVNIPRENSVIKDKVLVIGEQMKVELAVKHIWKMVTEAEQPKEPKEKTTDKFDKDDEPNEPWMNAYMYKRK